MRQESSFQPFKLLDLDPILFLMTEASERECWSPLLATVTATWYRRFLYLCKLHPAARLVPTAPIDVFWHYHILDTVKYHEDCEGLFGYYLHHFPYLGARGPEDQLELAREFQNTLRLFQEHFGSDPISATRALVPAEQLPDYLAATECSVGCGQGPYLKEVRPIPSFVGN